MDNVTAVLLGAAVGSLATVAAAIAGPAIAARTTSRRIHRSEVREEIARVLHSFVLLSNARRAGAPDQLVVHADAVTAVTRLSVLLGPRELEIERALGYALGLVANEKYAAGVAASEAMQVTLHAWYRGEVKGKKIGDRYGVELERALERALPARR